MDWLCRGVTHIALVVLTLELALLLTMLVPKASFARFAQSRQVQDHLHHGPMLLGSRHAEKADRLLAGSEGTGLRVSCQKIIPFLCQGSLFDFWLWQYHLGEFAPSGMKGGNSVCTTQEHCLTELGLATQLTKSSSTL